MTSDLSLGTTPLVSDGINRRYFSPKGILLVMVEPAIYHLDLGEAPLQTNAIKLRDFLPWEVLPKEGTMPQEVHGNSLLVPLFRGDILHEDLYSPDLLGSEY